MLSICEAILLLFLSGGMGMVCALFSYFLDYSFWPGSIFKFYLPWLARNVLYYDDVKKHSQLIMIATLHPETYNQQLIDTAQDKFWFKILGGCSICFNIWIALISWVIISSFTFFPWYYAFPYILVSSRYLRKLQGVD